MIPNKLGEHARSTRRNSTSTWRRCVGGAGLLEHARRRKGSSYPRPPPCSISSTSLSRAAEQRDHLGAAAAALNPAAGAAKTVGAETRRAEAVELANIDWMSSMIAIEPVRSAASMSPARRGRRRWRQRAPSASPRERRHWKRTRNWCVFTFSSFVFLAADELVRLGVGRVSSPAQTRRAIAPHATIAYTSGCVELVRTQRQPVRWSAVGYVSVTAHGGVITSPAAAAAPTMPHATIGRVGDSLLKPPRHRPSAARRARSRASAARVARARALAGGGEARASAAER